MGDFVIKFGSVGNFMVCFVFSLLKDVDEIAALFLTCYLI